MPCTVCGHENPAGSRFCTSCGRPLTSQRRGTYTAPSGGDRQEWLVSEVNRLKHEIQQLADVVHGVNMQWGQHAIISGWGRGLFCIIHFLPKLLFSLNVAISLHD